MEEKIRNMMNKTDSIDVIGEVLDASIPDNIDHIQIEMERDYPNMTEGFREAQERALENFKQLQDKQYKLFLSKQYNYGPKNIAVRTNLETDDEIRRSLQGIWFRLLDKISRYEEMVFNNREDAVGESIIDTFIDTSVYSLICQVVSNKKWAR